MGMTTLLLPIQSHLLAFSGRQRKKAFNMHLPHTMKCTCYFTQVLISMTQSYRTEYHSFIDQDTCFKRLEKVGGSRGQEIEIILANTVKTHLY